MKKPGCNNKKGTHVCKGLGRNVQAGFVSLLLTILFGTSTWAQQLGVYAFTGAGACPTQSPNVTAQPANAVFTSFSSIGTTCVATTDAFVYRSWGTLTTINTAVYNQFTITPNTGYGLNLTSLTFSHQTNANATPSSIWAIRSSVDNYAADIATGTSTTTLQTTSVSLPAADFTSLGAVTFRLYLMGASNGSTTSWLNDNVSLNGAVVLLPANPANPTSNSPQCITTGVTLTRSGTPPAGETWFWQTSATDRSTANSASTYLVNTTGTYFIRSRNNTTLAWSNGAGSLAVSVPTLSTNPASATVSTATICNGSSTILTLNGGGGGTNTVIRWYSGSCGGTLVGTGNNLTVSPTATTTYFGRYEDPAPCSNNTACASVTVTVNQPSVAATSVSTSVSTICTGGSIILTQAGGTLGTGASWRWYSDATFTTLVGTSTAANASLTVTPSATTTYYLRAEGTSSPCTGIVASSSSVTVTVNALGTAPTSLGATGTLLCNGTSSTLSQTGGALGTNMAWRWYTDAAYTTLVATNTISTADLTVTPATTTTYYLRAEGVHTSCTMAALSGITLTVNQPSVAPTALNTTSSVICRGSSMTLTQTGGTIGTNAVWRWYTDVSFSTLVGSSTAANASLTLSPTVTTTYYLRAEGTEAPCTANAAAATSITITVHTASVAPAALSTDKTTICSGSSVTLSQSGGSLGTTAQWRWYADAAYTVFVGSANASHASVTIAPANSATYYLRAEPSSSPCPIVTGPATVSVTVFQANAAPTSLQASPAWVCVGGTTRLTQAGGTLGTGATWRWYTNSSFTNLAGSSTAADAGLNVTLAAATTYYLRAEGGTAPCSTTPVAASGTVTVGITPNVSMPVFTLGNSSSRCIGGGTTAYTATANDATTITYSLDAASVSGGNAINPTNGFVNFATGWSGPTYITATATGCGPAQSATHTVNFMQTVATPVFSLGSTSTRCKATSTVTYTATAANSTGVTYALDVTSTNYGNNIDAATGAVTFVVGWTGISTITATATGCNGPTTATHTVSTLAPVATPAFALGATSIRCKAAGTVQYQAAAANSISVSYSLDTASLAAGNTINSATGTVTYVSGWSGTAKITATSTGCAGTIATTSHNATTSTIDCTVPSITIELIPKGSRIINMGIIPQTGSNGLKPYGLIYQLLNNNVPVKWIINQAKVKDGSDLEHNGVTYRGSAFIILAEYLTPAINTLISSWTSQGVVVNTTVSDFSAEVTYTLKTPPRWVLDVSQTILGRRFLDDAGIPSSAWIQKTASQLNNCDDIFILPHADVTWNEHKNLFYWNQIFKGSIWVGCYAASDMENTFGPDISNSAITRRMNFLMTDGGGLGQSAVPANQHQTGTPPFNYNAHGHPVMQFIGRTDGAHQNGPEQIYLPNKAGGWRSTTFIGSFDPSQKNIPGVSNGPASPLAFGRAFGDTSRGWVMYESGHNIDNSTNADEVAAVRALLNFSFFDVRQKTAFVTLTGVPSSVISVSPFTVTASATSQNVNPTFTYQWISTAGGTFANATAAATTFTPPVVTSATFGLITCKITDNCGRVAFDTKGITFYPSARRPVAVSDHAVVPSCAGSFVSINVLANDTDPDGGALTVTLIGNGSRGTFTNNGDGTVTYVPTKAFNGNDQVSYRICNPFGLCDTSTIRVNTNLLNSQGCSFDQYFGVVNTLTATLASSSNTPANRDNALGEPDGIPGDPTTYTEFTSTAQSIVLSMSTAIPVSDILHLYVDGTSGSKITVSESADSITFTNTQTYNVQASDDFTEANAKQYPVSAGTRWVRISASTITVQLDAVVYNVKGCISAYPIPADDETQTLEDNAVVIDVDANDFDPQNLSMVVSGIVSQPKRGRVSINPNNTITYLNFRDQVGMGLDTFSYSICNTRGLCATATVVVTVIADGCASNNYKPIGFTLFVANLNPSGDSYIDSRNATSNYGSANSLNTFGKTAQKKRIVMQFNLSSIPSNALVDSAILGLYHTGGTTADGLAAYRLTRSWSEAGVTWRRSDASNFWTTAGGDANPNIVASKYLSGGFNVYKTLNVKSTVQNWLSGFYPNFGLTLLKNPENSSTKEQFFNSNNASSNKPYLYVTYRVPLPCTAIPAQGPLALPDTATTNSVTPINIAVAANDFDYNNTGLSVSRISIVSSRGGTITRTNNILTYTPPATTPAFNGIDTFMYKVTSSGLSDSAHVYVVVTNAPPVANRDDYTIQSNTPTTPSSVAGADVRVNDTDPEASALTIPVIITRPKSGQASFDNNGLLTYTPDLNFIGGDTLVYQLSETVGSGCTIYSDTALVVFRVTNRPPVSFADSLVINSCEVVRIYPLRNDVDPEGGNMTINVMSTPAIGALALTNSNTEFIYTPPSGASNVSATFTYRACDNANPSLCGNTVSVKITIRIPPQTNSAPIAKRDTFSVNRNSTLYADVLTNDIEPDGHDFKPVEVITNPTKGTVSLYGDFLVKYVPNNMYFGMDSFQYRVSDTVDQVSGCERITSLSATAWAYIVVQDAPIADWERVRTTRGQSSTFNILSNDIFGAYGPATGTIAIATAPARGIATVLPNGSATQANNTITYTPISTYTGLDSFIYRITDAKGTSDTAMLYVWVVADMDGDGIGDDLDLDDDNDGIPDFLESCGAAATTWSCTPNGTDPSGDEDIDGIINYKDADWAALNSAGCAAFLDSDGDGVPNYLDRNSDNDGIPDVVEALGVDANGDGVIDNLCDSDGDGLSQNVDANNTGAAGSGAGLGHPDFDGDGIPNYLDLDSDNDGIPDLVEAYGTDANNDGRSDSFTDMDGDGWGDQYDGDANGDGIVENLVGVLILTGPDPLYVNCTNPGTGRATYYTYRGNADNHGLPNFLDLDSDGDGLTDATEGGIATVSYFRGMVSGCTLTNGWCASVRAMPALNLRNTDNHGRPDLYDIDSDNDGITDNVEAQPTGSFVVATDTDTDGDGIANVYDFHVGVGANGITPYDHDFDGIPDHMDLDSDNDGAFDRNEGDTRHASLTQATINASGDADDDGLVDYFDTYDLQPQVNNTVYRNISMSNMGPGGNFDGPTPSGSKVQLVRSVATAGNRDWRNSALLPMQIVSFTATLENLAVKLNWKVENEYQTEKYVVERSIDGISYQFIGEVKAANTGSISYSYTDNIAGMNVPGVYYRVQQLNKTGEKFYTRIIYFDLRVSSNDNVRLYPNPIKDVLNIRILSTSKQTAEVTVCDAAGKTLIQKTFMLVKGENIVQIPEVEKLISGLLVVHVKTTDATVTEKIVR